MFYSILKAFYNPAYFFEFGIVQEIKHFLKNLFSSCSVFDGHGGSKIANYVSKNLHKVITKREEYKAKDYENALIQVQDIFMVLDNF